MNAVNHPELKYILEPLRVLALNTDGNYFKQATFTNFSYSGLSFPKPRQQNVNCSHCFLQKNIHNLEHKNAVSPIQWILYESKINSDIFC